jgi:Leucine-rich repeat (LRR) protein
MPASQYPYLPDPRSLTGHLPTDLTFSTTLQRLELYGNNFTGGLLMLANLTGLISLDLHFNLFGGPLPDLVKSSATLEYVSFANNRLTGTIPTSYGKLSTLTTLGLASNFLGGTLAVVSELKALTVIYMRNNSFVGPMPSVTQSAAVVDLDDNMLTSFPTDMCDKPLSPPPTPRPAAATRIGPSSRTALAASATITSTAPLPRRA